VPEKSIPVLLESQVCAQLNLSGQNTQNHTAPNTAEMAHHWCQGHRCKKSKSIALFTLTYPEHLGAAGWAYALSCGSAIFHGYFFGLLHFSLGFAFHTISFHLFVSFSFCFVKSFAPQRALRTRA